MLPWWHLATSLIISYSLVALLGLDFATGLKWIYVGCIAGTLIDLDHLLYAFLEFREKALTYIKNGILNPTGLIKDFYLKGSLKHHAYRRLILHTFTMLGSYSFTLYAFSSYSLIVGLMFIVHLLLDIEPRWLLA